VIVVSPGLLLIVAVISKDLYEEALREIKED